MAFESKPNQCGLFTDDKPDRRSDFSGRIDVVCLHCGALSGFWMNGWRKVSQKGMEYLNIALKPRRDSAPHGEGDRRDP